MANNVTLQPWWYESPVGEDQLIWRIVSNPWDLVYIDGFLLPGISKIEISKSHKLDVKASAGRHFSTITDQGYKPCDVVITTTIWTPYQWGIWQANILPMIEPPPTKGYKEKLHSYSISNPASHARQIEAITIETISGPTIGHVVGTREMKIKALEWSKNSNLATKTPKSSGVGIKSFTNALTGANPATAPIPTRH